MIWTVLFPSKEPSEYHNLVLVDFHYFYSVCNEIYGRYHKLHDIDVSKMDLRPLVSLFLNQIAENDFDKYLLVFVKEVGRSECLDGVDLSCLLTTYKNVEFIEVPNFETDLCGTLFLLFKNYYLNDRFFTWTNLLLPLTISGSIMDSYQR